MTQITYDRHYDKHVLVCAGHTEYSPGSDILCSAVSTLCYCAKAYFEKAYAEGAVTDLKVALDKGFFALSFECEENSYALEVLKAVIEGFDILSEQFPDHISLDA